MLRQGRDEVTLTSGDEAVACERQIEAPCHDCPFARASLPGWLGSMSVDEWIRDVHGEAQINCHAFLGPQCAGAAIYRRNVAKKPHSAALLLLPADRKLVFASPTEFREHHGEPDIPKRKRMR